VINIDQSPIGRLHAAIRTYTGTFGPIRTFLRPFPESRIRAMAGRFSFNVKEDVARLAAVKVY